MIKVLKIQSIKGLQNKGKIRQEAQLELFEDNSTVLEGKDTYKNSLEWMMEFPEVLSNEGVLRGLI